MRTTLTSFGDLAAGAEREQARHEALYPGDPGGRQPIHTVYVPADRFSATTPADFGAEASRLLRAHAPGPEALTAAFGIDASVAGAVWDRVAAKLEREPIEDIRIDFEDGYGVRSYAEEDGHAVSAAQAVAELHEAGTLPPFWGLRVKSFADGLHARSMRTLDGFLTAVLGRLGRLPPGFTVTFPKVVRTGHVAAFTEFCRRLESVLGLSAGTLRYEVQIETTQSVLGLQEILGASAGRMSGAHFGVFDYTAACGLPPDEQRLDHPACDYARHVMQTTLAGTGVRLSDGSTNITPASDATSDVHAAWRIHAAHVRHSLRHGFYQGWDLHPSHLPSRYAVVYAFHLAGIDDVIARVRAWTDKSGGDAGILDEPATIKTLTARLGRAADCGAIDR